MNTLASSKSGSQIIDFFVQLYKYKEYLKQSVMRDLRNKYKRSFLGYLWTMLHPLGMMAILAVVFSKIMGVGIKDYAVFVFCGLLPWSYFNSTAMMSLSSIRANARLFGQVPVPKYIFIISIAFSNLVNFILAIVPLILIMVVTGQPLSWYILTLPIIILPIFFIVVAISLLLAASNVFFDDTLHLAEVGLQGLYFLCPILYERKQLPPELLNIVLLNPIFCQIEFIRDIFYYARFPDPTTFCINFIGSLVILIFSLKTFMKVEDKFLYFI